MRNFSSFVPCDRVIAEWVAIFATFRSPRCNISTCNCFFFFFSFPSLPSLPFFFKKKRERRNGRRVRLSTRETRCIVMYGGIRDAYTRRDTGQLWSRIHEHPSIKRQFIVACCTYFNISPGTRLINNSPGRFFDSFSIFFFFSFFSLFPFSNLFLNRVAFDPIRRYSIDV